MINAHQHDIKIMAPPIYRNNKILTDILETVQGIRRDNKISDLMKYLAIAGIGATVAAAGLYINYRQKQPHRLHASQPLRPYVHTGQPLRSCGCGQPQYSTRVFAENPNKEVPILNSPSHIDINELREKIKEVHQIAEKL